MSSCNNKKTGYTSYKTLSYVIKCIFLMCAFFVYGVISKTDKVEAAATPSVSFKQNNTSSCWYSGSGLIIMDNCDKYEYVLNYSATYTLSNTLQSFYVTVGGTKYGDKLEYRTGGGYTIQCRGGTFSNLNVTITYSKTATSVTYSSLYTRTSLSYCYGRPAPTDNNIYVTIPLNMISQTVYLDSLAKWSTHGYSGDLAVDTYSLSVTDLAPPSITNLKITNSSGGNWTKDNITVTASGAYDVGSGIGRYQYKYDGRAWGYMTTSGDTGTVTFTSDLNKTLYFKVCDAAGNCSGQSTLTTVVKRDSVAPTISTFTVSGNSGADSGYTNSTSISYSITASDATSGLGKYEVKDGSSAIYSASATKPTTDTLANSTNGAHTLTLTVTDVAGNTATATASITLDTVAPTISTFNVTGNSSADSGYTNTTSVTYSITASDATSGIKNYSIKDGSTSIYNASATKPTSGTLANSTAGAHSITLTVKDKAGNSATKTYSLTYDATNPTISSFTITGNSSAQSGYTNTTSVSVSISASDATAGIKTYSIKDGSTSVYSNASKPSSIVLANTTNGSHNLALTITDKAGNSATYSSQSIILDTVAPTIVDFIAYGNGAASSGYTNTTSINYSLNASDTTSGIRYYTIKDGTSVIYSQSATKPTSDVLANTNTGNHSLTLTVTDKAGNTNTFVYTIYYDPTVPTISTFNVLGNSDATLGYTKQTAITFSITSSDALSGVRNYTIYDGSDCIIREVTTKPAAGTLNTTTQGTHTIKLVVTDHAGNSAEKTYNIILDTTAPVISSFTYTGNANAMTGYTNQQAISYTLNVTDTYFKSGSVTPYNTSGTACSANAKSITSKSSSGSINLCDTTNGTHQLKVSATDHAGNAASASTSYNIIMDTVAPVLDLTTTLSPSLPKKNGTATITYTEKYPRVTMAGETLRYVLATDATSSANMTCTVVTSTTLTQDDCFGSSALVNTSTDVYSLTITLAPTLSSGYYLRVVDENLAMDRAGNVATSPVSKVNMIVNEETISTYVFGGYLIDQTAPTVSLSLGNGSYNGSGTSTIHYSKTAASITVTFSDNMYLWNYSDTLYYRYCWSTTTTCSSWTPLDGTRSKTQVSGSVTVPSTIGTHYLILEGDVRDYAGWYPTNSYLYTSRSSTTSGTRVFKFVTDNTSGTLTIGHTKVGDTYYAKPGITASVNYTDNTALRGYANTNNHMYAWSKSATTISGWSDTYLNTMPSKLLKKIGGITTPTTEGIWYLMLYSQSTDAAGNTISTPSTYGTATVQYKYWAIFAYSVTVKVYKFIIDGTSPEFVIEHDEDTYYGLYKDEDGTNELNGGDVIKFAYKEENGVTTKIDNTEIYYYISTEEKVDNMVNFDLAIEKGLSGLVDNYHKINFDDTLVIMPYLSGYYMYVYMKCSTETYNLYSSDYAGNQMLYERIIEIAGEQFIMTKFHIVPQSVGEEQNFTLANKAIESNKDNDDITIVNEDCENVKMINNETENILQILNGNIFLYTINNITSLSRSTFNVNLTSSNGSVLPQIVAEFNLSDVILHSAYDSQDNISDSKTYIDILLQNTLSDTKREHFKITLVVFNNAPKLIENTENSAVKVNQGEELANVGMSFESIDGSEVSVDTLITLDGVKVKSVDTSVPGVYNVTQVAKDKLGRTTRVNKEIVVLANKEVKEEIVEEVIEVVEEVVTLPAEVKVNNERVEEVKTIEVNENRVEMQLENKSKVNGYKKRKEIRKNKKEKETLKLLLRTISTKKIIRHI